MREILCTCNLPHGTDHFLSIVLANWQGRWVTWIYNKQDGGYHSGHYFENEDAARRGYAQRVIDHMQTFLSVTHVS